MATDTLYSSNEVVMIKSEGNAVQANDGTYIYFYSGDSERSTGASYGGSSGGLAGSTPTRVAVPTAQVARSVTLSVTVTERIGFRANKNTVSVTKCATRVNDGTTVDSKTWSPKQFPTELRHTTASDSTILEASGFNFNIPTGADIVGIKVEVTRSSGGAVSSDEAELFLSKWFSNVSAVGVLLGSFDSPYVSVTEDAGLNWTTSATPGYWINSLAANADGSVLVAATWEDADGVGGLYRSINKGVTWSKLTPGASVPTVGTEFDSGLMSFTNSLFTVFDKTTDKVWSSANGSSWTEHTNAPRGAISLGASGPIYYWSASSRYYSPGPCDSTISGLYTSTNLNTWTKVTDLETGASGGQLITGDLAFGDKAVGDATDLMVIAPNSDTGVVRLWHTAGTGANPSMTDVTPAGEAGDTVCIATDGSGRFMVGLDNGTIQYSDNAGSTWSGAIDVVAANTQNIANLYYNTANSRWIAGVENEGIYESTDGGDTWSKVNDWAASTDVHYPVFWEV